MDGRRLTCGGRWRRLLVVVSLFTTLSGSTLLAQDPGRYRPKSPIARAMTFRLADPPYQPLEDSTDVLVEELRGIMILDCASRVQDLIAPFDGVRTDPLANLTVAREVCFTGTITPYLGRPISPRSLSEMARNIVYLYRDRGQPAVDVSMPPGQDITDGVVQVVITESTVGCVRFDCNCRFDDCVLQQQSWLRSGQHIYAPCLEQELIWYNRNPFRDVSVDLQPGIQPCTTDIVYKVRDKKTVRWYAGYEDSGTRLTSIERLVFGFNLGNAWGKDRQLSYQYTTDAELDGTIGVHSVIYQVPIFENRDTWTVFGSWANIDADLVGPNIPGEGWQISGRYRHTLCQTRCQVDELQFGFDTKGTNNDLDFGGSTVLSQNAEIVNFMVGVNSQQQYNDGTTNYALDIFGSPGYLLGRNTNSALSMLRPGAKATYAYGRASVERVYNIDCRRDFVVRAAGQLSTDKLLPTEQLGFGGYDTLRGYDMRTVNGDAGYFVNFEYRTKPVSGCCNGKPTSLTLLAFSDLGQQFNYGNNAGEADGEFLASAGIGFRYLVDPNCTIRFDYGVPLTRLGPLTTARDNSAGRVHVGAVIAY